MSNARDPFTIGKSGDEYVLIRSSDGTVMGYFKSIERAEQVSKYYTKLAHEAAEKALLGDEAN